MAIKANTIGTKAHFKQVGTKGGGGDDWVVALSDGDVKTFRFLTEPEQWVEYLEHFDPTLFFYPCSDDCPGCKEGKKPTKKFLAAVIDVEEGKVVPFKMPKSVVGDMYVFYEKYDTVMDRDYEVRRNGSTKENTEYRTLPEAPSRVKFSRFPVPAGSSTWEQHLLGLLEKLDPSVRDAEAEEAEAPPTRNGKAKSNGSAADAVRRRARVRDEDEGEDEDEDETFGGPLTKRKISKSKIKRS